MNDQTTFMTTSKQMIVVRPLLYTIALNEEASIKGIVFEISCCKNYEMPEF